MKLFLSHAFEDQDVALAIAQRVKRAGGEVWLEAEDLKAGDLWAEQLEAAREASGGLLVLITPASAADIAFFEGGYAYARRKWDPSYRVLPVWARGASAEETPEMLLSFKAIDASSETDPDRIAEIVANALLERV